MWFSVVKKLLDISLAKSNTEPCVIIIVASLVISSSTSFDQVRFSIIAGECSLCAAEPFGGDRCVEETVEEGHVFLLL